MQSHSLLNLCFVCLFYGAALVESTISPSDKGKKAKASKELKVNSGPIDQNVIERNLIEDEPSAKDILVENAAYYQNTSARLFDGPVLVYVTPVSANKIIGNFYYFHANNIQWFQWNNHGYDVAKMFGPKFSMVSPVWLQVLRRGRHMYELGGAHDIDVNWIRDVRAAGPEKQKCIKLSVSKSIVHCC